MKPAWDNVVKASNKYTNMLVGNVDCIGKGKGVCEEYDVQAFPKILYGDPSKMIFLHDYQGG